MAESLQDSQKGLKHCQNRFEFDVKYRNWTASDWNKVIFSYESQFLLYRSDRRPLLGVQLERHTGSIASNQPWSTVAAVWWCGVAWVRAASVSWFRWLAAFALQNELLLCKALPASVHSLGLEDYIFQQDNASCQVHEELDDSQMTLDSLIARHKVKTSTQLSICGTDYGDNLDPGLFLTMNNSSGVVETPSKSVHLEARRVWNAKPTKKCNPPYFSSHRKSALECPHWLRSQVQTDLDTQADFKSLCQLGHSKTHTDFAAQADFVHHDFESQADFGTHATFIPASRWRVFSLNGSCRQEKLSQLQTDWLLNYVDSRRLCPEGSKVCLRPPYTPSWGYIHAHCSSRDDEEYPSALWIHWTKAHSLLPETGHFAMQSQ